MVFNPNAYNYSSDLSRIANSLGKAMFGSAADDAAIARRKYYDAQTEGQNLKNRGMSGNLDAIDAAAQGNIMRKSIANALGYDLDNGNLIQPVLPGGDQKSVPALGADQRNMDGGALMTELGNIARTVYGDGTSNANQLSQMLNNLGAAGASRLAESMILGGSDQQAQRGALLKAPQGGQFQNPGFAAQKLRTEDATNQRGQDMKQDTAERGQDMTQDTAMRGQNIKSTDTRRGQDMKQDTAERGQDMRSDSATDTRKRPSVKDTNANYAAITEAVDNYNTIPQAVRGKLRSALFANIDAGMKQDKSASYDAVYAKAVTEVLSAGVTEIDTAYNDGISDFGFPTYFYNQLQGRDADFITETAKDLGYSQKQITALVNQLANG